jgi:hypothetical protein
MSKAHETYRQLSRGQPTGFGESEIRLPSQPRYDNRYLSILMPSRLKDLMHTGPLWFGGPKHVT